LCALGTREFKEGVFLCPRRHWPTNYLRIGLNPNKGVSLCPRTHWPTNYLRIGLNPNNFVSIKQSLKKKDNKKWNIVTLLLGF
jgi:hypothetical protein